ncbi:MAG: pseudouridine-5'-phosphate glycosidase [Oscillospiraceae bacterium]|nr:pseudouridine-5'-phosphate glycosidase [Oscillospiraceae bacterium]
MASRYLDTSPTVAAALKAGTPIVVIETGFFMKLPYPKNKEALLDCEQAFWQRQCVPCCVAVVEGRLKAGLTKDDMDKLCQTGKSCARWELPGLVGSGETAGAGASAAMAIARMADIVPVMAPGLSDTLADLDALGSSRRLVFCGRVSPEKALLFNSRGVPVLRQEGTAVADAYQALRDLELSESAVVPCGDTLGDMADASSAAALELKKRSNFT